MPSVNVIIPCFSRADLLSECLASLLAQTFGDWDAVVVDDAWPGGDIEAVVKSYGDPRFSYIRHDRNLGPAAARNTAIRAGTARLVAPVDSDDILEPRFLERLCRELDEHPETDCVFPDFSLFGDASGVLQWGHGEARDLVERQWLPGPGCVYRRQFWERIGGYCEDPALRAGNEDWDFYLSAAEAGFTTRHIEEALYRYRVAPASTEMRLRYANFVTREFIARRHHAFFNRYGGTRRFLAAGYLVSAESSLGRMERRRALSLAFHAYFLDHRFKSVLPIIAMSVLPGQIVAVGRRLRNARRSRMH